MIQRLLYGLLLLLALQALLTATVRLLPGDPVKIILGPRANAELSARAKAELGLELPFAGQLLRFVSGLARGDLGVDFFSRRPVTQILLDALPHTVLLAVVSLALAAALGIPLGVLMAWRAHSWFDRIGGLLSIGAVTAPTYVVGLLLSLLFVVRLDWLPATGLGESGQPGDYLRHLVLPALTLALVWIGYLARLTRASMLDVLGADYIRTARASGAHGMRLLFRHALRNALLPVLTVLGLGLGSLFGGAVFVEVIFARPGLGRALFDAIATRNFPVLQGGVFATGALVLLANALADSVNRLIDPRLRGRA
jgi:peptide/nickel transport system permease protein